MTTITSDWTWSCVESSDSSANRQESADRLGAYVADMLIEMRSRGPDSAGIAIYGDGEVSGTTKLSLYSACR